MTPDEHTRPGLSEAESAFSNYLDRLGAGEESDFDAFCRKHAHVERELRALMQQWQVFHHHVKLVAPLTSELPSELSGLIEKLRRRCPDRASRYSVDGEVARGGMGVVFRVRDDELERDLAMKVVLGSAEVPSTGQTPPVPVQRLSRFLAEAKVTAKLDHPGIVPVHEMGLDAEGRVFFTMKLVEGRTLEDVIERVHRDEEGWTQTRALEALLRVCDALAYAHAKGVIHRDLKPSNVMVGAFGEVYVMDWGLARVVGEADEKDLRIRESVLEATGQDSPLRTMDGDVVGTPAFMSPEQAKGELVRLGPLSDVYSVGAILYAVLAGHAPYREPVGAANNYVVLERVRAGCPTPLERLVPDVPAELVSICEKAMARKPEARYASMDALAVDLRAFLEGRVVRAYETGAWAEAKKWIRRNQPLAVSLAAGVMLLVVGLVTAIVLRQQAVENLMLAKENEQEAKEQQGLAQKRAEDILSLSAFQKLEDLTKEADELWPPWPMHLETYDRWLAEAEQLVAGLEPSADGTDPGHRARLAELRQRALPWTDEEREAARRQHPRFAEFTTLKARLDSLLRAQAVRDGELQSPAFTLDPSVSRAKTGELNDRAWPLVDPDRTEFGREAEGLALANLAWERAMEGEERANIADTLAWAFFAVGQDREALAMSTAALAAAPAGRKEDFEKYLEKLRGAVEAARSTETLRGLKLEVAELDEVVSERGEWTFANDEDRWWHDQLARLVVQIEAFAGAETGLVDGTSPEHGWGIRKRRDWAATVDERTVSGYEVAAKWAACLERVAASERYAGLALEPQVGLVPLGPDPASGLEEFGHPLTGELAERDENGELVLTDDFGLVFVLLPAEVFTMGAQSDPDGPNYDPQAKDDEGPVHEVTLSAFFLSKFEMTQQQWQHFTRQTPSYYKPPNRIASGQLGPRHPVEQVSWRTCDEVTRHMGLSLPSEAQWEYGARAGTTTPWWPGKEPRLLQAVGNVADAYAKQFTSWTCEVWNDGHVVHAPVGTFRPNAFGLYDVHGNVWEWCLDGFDPGFYRRETGADPVCDPARSRYRTGRGGCFDDTAANARSAVRSRGAPGGTNNNVGLRPARSLPSRGK